MNFMAPERDPIGAAVTKSFFYSLSFTQISVETELQAVLAKFVVVARQ